MNNWHGKISPLYNSNLVTLKFSVYDTFLHHKKRLRQLLLGTSQNFPSLILCKENTTNLILSEDAPELAGITQFTNNAITALSALYLPQPGESDSEERKDVAVHVQPKQEFISYTSSLSHRERAFCPWITVYHSSTTLRMNHQMYEL